MGLARGQGVPGAGEVGLFLGEVGLQDWRAH